MRSTRGPCSQATRSWLARLVTEQVSGSTRASPTTRDSTLIVPARTSRDRPGDANHYIVSPYGLPRIQLIAPSPRYPYGRPLAVTRGLRFSKRLPSLWGPGRRLLLRHVLDLDKSDRRTRPGEDNRDPATASEHSRTAGTTQTVARGGIPSLQTATEFESCGYDAVRWNPFTRGPSGTTLPTHDSYSVVGRPSPSPLTPPRAWRLVGRSPSRKLGDQRDSSRIAPHGTRAWVPAPRHRRSDGQLRPRFWGGSRTPAA